MIDKTLRRSTRIRKINSCNENNEEKSTAGVQQIQILDNIKIEPCKVKIEQIDMLTENLNVATQESKSCEETKTSDIANVENGACIETMDEVQPSEPETSDPPKNINCSTDEASMWKLVMLINYHK